MEPYLRSVRHTWGMSDHFWLARGYEALASDFWPVEGRGAYRGPIRAHGATVPPLVVSVPARPGDAVPLGPAAGPGSRRAPADGPRRRSRRGTQPVRAGAHEALPRRSSRSRRRASPAPSRGRSPPGGRTYRRAAAADRPRAPCRRAGDAGAGAARPLIGEIAQGAIARCSWRAYRGAGSSGPMTPWGRHTSRSQSPAAASTSRAIARAASGRASRAEAAAIAARRGDRPPARRPRRAAARA